MLRQTKIIFLLGIIFNLVSSTLAQGTLETSLLPYGPSAPPLAGFANIYTPNTNSGGIFFPVTFQVTINSDQEVFDTGRIAGGGTAWVFGLGSPTISNGSMFFSGTTSMQAFQINDMLAGRTEFEISNENFTSYLRGSLVPVPEPRTTALFAVGLVAACLRRHLLPPRFGRAKLDVLASTPCARNEK